VRLGEDARDPTPRHWCRIYLETLKPLRIEGAPDAPRLATGEEARRKVESFLADHTPGPGPWVGVHPGGRIYRIPDPAAPEGVARLSRRWPPDRFAALVRLLLAGGTTVFLTGSDEDAPAARAILADASSGMHAFPPGRLIDTTGRLSLPETAALIERMDAFVSNDTGPMHLAFALDVPTVAIFGPTDPLRAGPLHGLPHRVLTPGLPCSPCGGEALVPCRNPNGQECLTAISVAEVYGAVKAALDIRGPAASQNGAPSIGLEVAASPLREQERK
jgi:ADP-heptose:LPS heptosyltransferase